MISYQKVGGLHWIKIGRLCIAFCIKRREQPQAIATILRCPTPYRPLPRIDLEDMFH